MATPNFSQPGSTQDFLSLQTHTNTFNYLNSKLPSIFTDKKVTHGIVCGSGLGGLSKLLTEPICEFNYKDIPNFGISTVMGHDGRLVFGMLAGQPTVCMVGRKHMYEGHSSIKTAFPIRIMHLLGVKTLILTNAVGALNPKYITGDIVVISDHISIPGIAGQNPLVGLNIEAFGPRFPAMSDAYDFDLRMMVFQAAGLIGLSDDIMKEGVYAYVAGPNFESRAEARFLREAGADVVGMSTLPEVLVARHCGMKVLGLSLVTNCVAHSHGRSAKEAYMLTQNMKIKRAKKNELNDESIRANHAEVLEAGNKMSKHMQTLVEKIVGMMVEFSKE